MNAYQPGYYSYEPSVTYYDVKQKTYLITAFSILIASLIVRLLLITGVPVSLFILGIIGWVVAMIFGFFARSETSQKILLFIIVPSSAITITPLIEAVIITGGAYIVSMALLLTGGIVLSAYFYNKIREPDFTGMGKYLTIGLWGLIIVGILSFFISLGSAFYFIYSIITAVLFTLYIFYDLSLIEKRSILSPYAAALNLYLDIFILFKNILYILLKIMGEK